MNSYATTMSTKGQIVIPADLRQEMGILPGTRIALIREGDRLILQPVDAKYVRSLRGMFAGGSSMSEDREREHRDDKW